MNNNGWVVAVELDSGTCCGRTDGALVPWPPIQETGPVLAETVTAVAAELGPVSGGNRPAAANTGTPVGTAPRRNRTRSAFILAWRDADQTLMAGHATAEAVAQALALGTPVDPNPTCFEAPWNPQAWACQVDAPGAGRASRSNKPRSGR